MKSIIFISMFLAGFTANAQTYIVEFQFSTNTTDLVSIQVNGNDQASKDFEDSLEFDGKTVGLGTELVVSKCIPKENNEIDIVFSATKRSVSEWKELPDGNQMPLFNVRSLNDTDISVVCGKWADLVKPPNLEQMRIRIIKKK